VQDLVPLLILVGFALLMWLLLVRPQARRQRELAQMQNALEVGDEVMLTSGVFGTLRQLDEEGAAHLEIADGVVIKVARQAIGQVVPTEDTTHDGDTEVSEEN
jgi:preprotein translocase subunit YajC